MYAYIEKMCGIPFRKFPSAGSHISIFLPFRSHQYYPQLTHIHPHVERFSLKLQAHAHKYDLHTTPIYDVGELGKKKSTSSYSIMYVFVMMCCLLHPKVSIVFPHI